MDKKDLFIIIKFKIKLNVVYSRKVMYGAFVDR